DGAYSQGYCCSEEYVGTLACSANGDCDDGDSCTLDICFSDGGVCTVACVNSPIIGCETTSPACGNGVCEPGEDDNICASDCGGNDTTANSVDGGGEVGSEGYKAFSRELTFSVLEVNKAASVSVKVSHGFPRLTPMNVQLHIFRNGKLVYFGEHNTSLLDPSRTFLIEFDRDWTPAEVGEYVAKIVLSNADKTVKFDIREEKITVNAQGTGNIVDDILGDGNDAITGGLDNNKQFQNAVESETIEVDWGQIAPLMGTAILLLGLIVFFLLKTKT
ncbi:MAG: hypothetical protein NUV67_03915, partial [archaeon]|nr:hypothetical protein [archaeon]